MGCCQELSYVGSKHTTFFTMTWVWTRSSQGIGLLKISLVAFSALTLLIRRQEGHLACKKMGGWWRWALDSPDGVAPSRMVCVNLPLHHKVRKIKQSDPLKTMTTFTLIRVLHTVLHGSTLHWFVCSTPFCTAPLCTLCEWPSRLFGRPYLFCDLEMTFRVRLASGIAFFNNS